jgi:hypothetical protein
MEDAVGAIGVVVVPQPVTTNRRKVKISFIRMGYFSPSTRITPVP